MCFLLRVWSQCIVDVAWPYVSVFTCKGWITVGSLFVFFGFFYQLVHHAVPSKAFNLLLFKYCGLYTFRCCLWSESLVFTASNSSICSVTGNDDVKWNEKCNCTWSWQHLWLIMSCMICSMCPLPLCLWVKKNWLNLWNLIMPSYRLLSLLLNLANVFPSAVLTTLWFYLVLLHFCCFCSELNRTYFTLCHLELVRLVYCSESCIPTPTTRLK